jgi:hypothetical protein
MHFKMGRKHPMKKPIAQMVLALNKTYPLHETERRAKDKKRTTENGGSS